MTQFIRPALTVLAIVIASRYINYYGSLIYFFLVPTITVLSVISIFYKITVDKKIDAQKFNNGKIANFLYRRKLWKYIIAILISLIIALFLPVTLYMMSYLEIAIALLSLLLAIPLAKYISNAVYHTNFKEYGISRTVKLFSVIIAIILYVPLITIAYKYIQPQILSLTPLEHNSLASLINNPIAHNAANYIVVTDHIVNILHFLFGDKYILSLVIEYVFVNGILFYGLCNIISTSLLGKEATGEALSSTRKDEESKYNYKYAYLLFVVLLIPTILLSSTVEPFLKKHNEKTNALANKSIEWINGIAYKVGTYDILEKERISFLYKANIPLTKEAINKYYNDMLKNVNNYLDWYYGLGAEFERMKSLVTFSFGDFIDEKIAEFITSPIDSEAVTNAITNLQKANKEYNKKIDHILEISEHVGSTVNKDVILDISNYNPRIISDINDKELVARFGFSAAVGAAAGFGTKKLGKEIAERVGKNSLMKAIGKMGFKRVTSGIAGISSSSFTAFAGGVAAFIATEKALLELEEYLSRDKYRKELIDAIEEDRKATLKLLSNEPA